jgi:hypothetical protein
MTENIPKLLVLSFHDGATEGFIDSVADQQIYFFKVVAWDNDQDMRLYIFGKVARFIYLELLDIILKSQPLSTSLAWTPTWAFANSDLEARANAIVEISKRSLSEPAYLALGQNLIDAVKVVDTTPSSLASAIALAGEKTPGNLANWLSQRG